jgi:hypothetical protein
MTTGQIYNKNKEIYDNEAIEYIDRFLPNIGYYYHRPFEMMTHYTRTICEKITDDIYLVFEGQVKSTKYLDGGEISFYGGRKDNASIYNKYQFISMFGFEISLNPRSKSNRSFQNLV